MDFPRFVYRSAANHMIVANEKQHADAIDAGWFESVPDALAGKSSQPAPVAPKPAKAKQVATPDPWDPV